MLHPGRTGRNHLRALAKAAGIGEPRVEELLELVALKDSGDRRAGGYSLGMRQRLGLAGALLGDPRVLMLDEPANGLDPQGIRWLRDFLRGLASEGRAILVSSHVLAEVAQTADDVVVINRGRRSRRRRWPRSWPAAAPAAGMKVKGPDVRRLGDLLYAQGVQVSGTDHEILVTRHERRGHRPPDRRAPDRRVRAVAGRRLARGRLLRAHRARREARHDADHLRRAVQDAHDAHVLRARRQRAARSSCCPRSRSSRSSTSRPTTIRSPSCCSSSPASCRSSRCCSASWPRRTSSATARSRRACSSSRTASG